MSQHDKSEAALLAEFGTYITAVTQSFSKPLRETLEDTQRHMMARIGAHQTLVEEANRAAEKELVAHHLKLKAELAELPERVRQIHLEAERQLRVRIEAHQSIVEVADRGAEKTLLFLEELIHRELAAFSAEVQSFRDFVEASKADIALSRKSFETNILIKLQDMLRTEMEISRSQGEALNELRIGNRRLLHAVVIVGLLSVFWFGLLYLRLYA